MACCAGFCGALGWWVGCWVRGDFVTTILGGVVRLGRVIRLGAGRGTAPPARGSTGPCGAGRVDPGRVLAVAASPRDDGREREDGERAERESVEERVRVGYAGRGEDDG